MNKEIGPAVFIGVILAAICLVVLFWVWRPFAPKVYGLERPSAAARHQAAEQMRQAMMEAAKHRAGTAGTR